LAANDGGHFGTGKFDGAEEAVVGEGGDRHLEVEAKDAAEGFADGSDLVGDLVGFANDEGTGGAAEGVELAENLSGRDFVFDAVMVGQDSGCDLAMDSVLSVYGKFSAENK
jgi:hypothetical protein